MTTQKNNLPHQSHSHAQPMKDKRKIAKMGLATSLALLTVTGFTHVLPQNKKVHTIAGLAMLGFSLWHVNLYKNSHKK